MNTKTYSTGDEVEIQISPFGDFPQTAEDGREVLQHVTPETSAAIVDAFRTAGDEILVDADHASEEGGSTAAYGWINALRVDHDDGLLGVVKLTDIGAEAFSGRRFRFVSPAWIVDETGNPTKLVSVALTNKPNIPLRPVVNRAAPSTVPGGTGSLVKNASEEAKEKETMEKLKELLGLAPEASDDDVAAAVQTLIDKVAEADAAALEAEAAELVAENEDLIEDPEAMKNAFKANPDVVRSILKNMKRPAAPAAAAPAPQKVVNTATAKKPVVKNSVREGLAACKTPAEQNAYLYAHADEL